MTTVAWDGRTLAADKQAVNGTTRCAVTKLGHGRNGEVLAYTGLHERGLLLIEWYRDGADPARWPDWQKDDDWTLLVVAKPDGECLTFEKLPVGQRVEDKFYVWGSGKPYALAAMSMGADAVKAVEVACLWDINSGGGADFAKPRKY